MKKPIRVMITDDHPIYREAASAALHCLHDIIVVRHCASGPETLEQIPQVSPDVILMDVRMQPMNGIETTEKIREQYPGIKVIGFSLETNPEIVKKMIRSGASGYVTKSSPRTEIGEAIAQVMQGKKYVCREVKNQT